MPGRSANRTRTRILSAYRVRMHDHKVLLDAVFGRDQTLPIN